MYNANVALAEEPAASLTEKFIGFASGLAYNRDLTPDNKAAQDMLFEAVADKAQRAGISLDVAYCSVTGEIAHLLGTTREELTQGGPSALKSAVRKVAYRCDVSTAPGWRGCK